MFTKTAEYYDALYHFIDYGNICNHIHELIQHQSPGASSLLDVGCGTGRHLSHLQNMYQAEGVDINNELLEIAKKNCPGVTFHTGDMRAFELNKSFDVVACLFSSIGYVKTETGLNDSLQSMTRHLNNNGLLLLEPWIWPEDYWLGKITANFVDRPELKISWMYISERYDDISVFDIKYMVGTPTSIEQFSEKHEMGLWTDKQYRTAMEKAGLRDIQYIKNETFRRGLYYGRKQ